MLKVLVVEDDASVASLVRTLLEDEGFATVTAADAEGAWSVLLTENPDAAIIDLWLFGREAGWDLLQRMRNNEHFHDLPIVVLTGVSGKDAVDRATELGCEYVSKPFSPATLLDRFRRVIRNSGRVPGMVEVAVAVFTNGYRVEGNVWVERDLTRFSDAWESVMRDTRQFLPLSNGRVLSPDGTFVIAEPGFVEIRKASIEAAFPR